jgi:hypothetical protein
MSESHDVSPEPPKAGSIAAVATEEAIEAEVTTSASTNLTKAPCKCASTTGNTSKCKFLCNSFTLKVQVSYTKKPYV